ncbi:MAG: aminoglycoside phosphotransferase family protein [Uliginosibacterium sp.]|nr:aminoglycoside phosphotransferase family protein [Uliginosibacterium sp.]
MLAAPALPDDFSLPGAPIASGATADVYACLPGWVLKLFHRRIGAAEVEHERCSAQAAFALASGTHAFRIPAVGGLVRLGDRYGLLYAQVEGGTLQEALFKTSPRLPDQFAQQLASLHSTLHTLPVSASPGTTRLPRQTERLRHAILHAKAVSEAQRAQALDMLEQQGGGVSCLCHGDFHLGNILVAANEPPAIIDWNDASLGNPLADLARSSLLICFGEAVSTTGPLAPNGFTIDEYEALRQNFNRVYLETYFRLNGLEDLHSELAPWLQIVATARLNENISTYERKRLQEFISA